MLRIIDPLLSSTIAARLCQPVMILAKRAPIMSTPIGNPIEYCQYDLFFFVLFDVQYTMKSSSSDVSINKNPA